MPICQGCRRDRKAATVIETAFVLGICILLALAIFEYGRFLMIRQMVDNAAREGARQAVVGTSSFTTAQIQQTVVNYLVGQPLQNTSGQPLQASDVQVYKADPTTGQKATPDSTWTNAAFGDSIAVQVQAVYHPMLPTFGFLPTSISLQATCVMRSEAN
jgi:Flp pilus assembly protein TadG